MKTLTSYLLSYKVHIKNKYQLSYKVHDSCMTGDNIQQRVTVKERINPLTRNYSL
jgi:hypothetical protein